MHYREVSRRGRGPLKIIVDAQRQPEHMRTLTQHVGVSDYNPRNNTFCLALGLLNNQIRANTRWFTWSDDDHNDYSNRARKSPLGIR
jgi:hypothetical protein